MRVLFALDGSSHSLDAVSQIGRLLTAGKDEAIFYCSPPELQPQSRAINQELLAQARQALVNSIFEEACKHLPAELHGAVQKVVGTRDPRHGIVLAAEQAGAQLIVVGARGLGRLDRMLLGSVSRSVVHNAKIPVWVARPARPAGHAGLRVVLACESPELARPAVDLLAKLSWPPKSECRAMTVISGMFAGRVPDWLQQQARSPEVESMVQAWAREHDAELRSNVARIQQFIQTLPAGFPACQPLVAEGDAASEILATLAREHADLVVVGVHRKGFFSSELLGSTSEAVLNHATCSVLTVPHQEAP